MRIFQTLFLGSALIALGTPFEAFASWDVDRLNQARESSPEAFERESELFSEAIAFSLMQSQSRAKLPGPFKPYGELGFHVFQVEAETLRNFTSTGRAPLYARTLYLKGGIGLPFGFAVEGGFSQVLSEHNGTGANLSVSSQVLDFANMVYIDIVPAATVTGSIMRTMGGPGLWNFTGQTVLGAYHRLTLAQFGYILQVNYSILSAISPSVSSLFVRHGIMTNLPIYKGVFLRNEIFFPSMSATVATGFQF